MTEKLRKIIIVLFHILFFTIPLIFFQRNSELFEFNKIVFLYLVTTCILTTWVIISIFEKKVVIKRTFLDWPLLIFLSTQLLSTLLSIDTRTSIFGYYSRWNGGLLSSISYASLYWAYVTFMDQNQTLKIIKTLLLSTVLTSIYGILEHFGHSPSCYLITGKFDVDCWVQDVRLRVFSTFGQPNWQAAWLVGLIPLTWAFFKEKKFNIQSKKTIIFVALNALFFATLLFTKSRSGILGFAASVAIFLGLILAKKAEKISINYSLLIFVPLIAVSLIFGTPWTPKITDLLNKSRVQAPLVSENKIDAPSLETGGTESGEIRKIVWAGAINVWKIYPLFGSGVETFALSYYQGRPMEHNITSEWNFLYNKAHNEYLNYLATSGLVGFAAYSALIISVFILFYKALNQEQNKFTLYIGAIASGYCAILISNFFGFSVVPTSLLFFLLPAFTVTLQSNEQYKLTNKNEAHSNPQIIEIIFAAFTFIFIFINIINYWKADYLYAKAQKESESGDYQSALKDIDAAISLSPAEPIYRVALGGYYADLSRAAKESKDDKLLQTFKVASVSELEKTVELSGSNIKLLKQTANIYEDLSEIDSIYNNNALDILGRVTRLAPTDPSAVYQKGYTLAKSDHVSEGLENVRMAVEMKPNYKIARRFLAFLYENTNQKDKAIEELQYILKYISPDDTDVQKELDGLLAK